jgi:hypothetical protein
VMPQRGTATPAITPRCGARAAEIVDRITA